MEIQTFHMLNLQALVMPALKWHKEHHLLESQSQKKIAKQVA